MRVLDQENRYNDAMIVAKGVRWAVDHGAKVINLSLGGSGSSAALAAALDYAFAKDVVVVACTGNASASPSAGVWYPAREPGVLAVAGMERDGDRLWSGSITGKETVVTAPATELVGARPSGYWGSRDQLRGTDGLRHRGADPFPLAHHVGRRGDQPDHRPPRTAARPAAIPRTATAWSTRPGP